MNKSIDFFDRQFRQAPSGASLQLNPFEERALPHVRGEALDFGSGMGNLAFAAATRGCRVTALDGSAAAVAHMQQRAALEGLPVVAMQADLSDYPINHRYDTERLCLFTPEALQQHFAGWHIDSCELADFDAPGQTVKRFCTLIAHKPDSGPVPT